MAQMDTEREKLMATQAKLAADPQANQPRANGGGSDADRLSRLEKRMDAMEQHLEAISRQISRLLNEQNGRDRR